MRRLLSGSITGISWIDLCYTNILHQMMTFVGVFSPAISKACTGGHGQPDEWVGLTGATGFIL